MHASGSARYRTRPALGDREDAANRRIVANAITRFAAGRLSKALVRLGRRVRPDYPQATTRRPRDWSRDRVIADDEWCAQDRFDGACPTGDFAFPSDDRTSR
jgi:hypothetical protein